MGERQLIPLKDARLRLGVSKVTMARLVREGRFPVYQNPLDRRQKLVDLQEIEEFARPQRLESSGDRLNGGDQVLADESSSSAIEPGDASDRDDARPVLGSRRREHTDGSIAD